MHTRTFLQLRGTQVRTAAEIKLGTVRDIIFDADSGRLFQIAVRTRLLGGTDLLVPFDAIIEIRDDGIIVKDGVVPSGAPALA